MTVKTEQTFLLTLTLRTLLFSVMGQNLSAGLKYQMTLNLDLLFINYMPRDIKIPQLAYLSSLLCFCCLVVAAWVFFVVVVCLFIS